MTDLATPPPAVDARDLALHGRRGVVYGPVDMTIDPGTLTILHGPQGGGRTSLLLTLAGRMVPDRDSRLTVLGHPLPAERRSVQRVAALAGFTGIDELDESVTVGALLRERLGWLAAWYRRTPAVTSTVTTARLARAFGDRAVPAPGTLVWDLDEVDLLLLRIGLALVQQPDLLVVDDVDQVHDDARRQLVWSRLEALAADGLTVVASCASSDEVDRMRWTRRPTVVALATGPHLD
ncbi:ATP-binding cassette domain-containing protein [Cellulomonas sp.]|uniref:ATP-binding cassette domain-containing protein n=1 Tax=Cellulomonas sp. TaxID=40001 RepID=UPI001AFE36EA|nr:ATP-binding cassette domain-containing protein [Cellulomonas sp.]MBO9553946.1 AAA family ATPase [Cellulomonas sp.]